MATPIVEINPKQIDYLLKKFDLDQGQLVRHVNTLTSASKLKRRLDKKDLMPADNRIKLSHLKKIDELFERGLHFYTNPITPPRTQRESIFFSKKPGRFSAELKLKDAVSVSSLEDKIKLLNRLLSGLGLELPRKFKLYEISDDPMKVADEVRKELDIRPHKEDKDFLKAFINALSRFNLITSEILEHPTKKYKCSYDGMYTQQKFIFIKRQQAYKREIFTLAHELGHHLLDKADIDSPLFRTENSKLDATENWCNYFASHFLADSESLEEINKDTPTEQIANISNKTHLSRLAIYTYMLDNDKILWADYKERKQALENEYRQQKLQKEKMEQEQGEGKRFFGSPKPVFSDLEEKIYRNAYFDGAIEEIDVVNYLRFSKEQIRKGAFDKFLYG